MSRAQHSEPRARRKARKPARISRHLSVGSVASPQCIDDTLLISPAFHAVAHMGAVAADTTAAALDVVAVYHRHQPTQWPKQESQRPTPRLLFSMALLLIPVSDHLQCFTQRPTHGCCSDTAVAHDQDRLEPRSRGGQHNGCRSQSVRWGGLLPSVACAPLRKRIFGYAGA